MTKTINTKLISIITLLAVLTSFLIYIYSYQKAISYTVSIQKIENEILGLKSKISEKEVLIVENKRKINKEIALTSGFVSLDEDVKVIKRNKNTALNLDEITN